MEALLFPVFDQFMVKSFQADRFVPQRVGVRRPASKTSEKPITTSERALE
jgi:hypothetical protein